MTHRKKLAILVGGGPAPGINSVIAAVTIRALLEGVDVVGIEDGFDWIMQGNIDHVRMLTIDAISRIHFRGGSHIGISRANPTKDPQLLENAVISLLRLGVTDLVTIGGDDTAFSAMKLEEKAAGRIDVVHVPKSIDNDLDLPSYVDTFGYQTARHHGVEIVKNIMVDAKTTSRWYFIIAMGRKAGHLALGIGKAAGATLTLDARGVHDPADPAQGARGHARLRDHQAARVRPPRRRRRDRRGRGAQHRPAGLRGLRGRRARRARPRAHRRGEHRRDAQARGAARLKEFGLSTTIVEKNIGYELRCADPIPQDMEYTRDLGYCAAKYLLEGGNSVLISMQSGQFVPIPFRDLLDPVTGRARTRMVDIHSTRYAIARRYMIRLRRDDFEDEHELARFAATAHMSLQEFRDQFEYLIRDELPAIHLFDQNLAKAMRESSAARAAAVKPSEAASAAKGGD